ncbi:G2/M phase-specific E3 ubiquitin-protein ligase [Nymphon striatum]|nr:G2/M phase-specific E3 ubiquitin-protein ligase [Nymphon striatum]
MVKKMVKESSSENNSLECVFCGSEDNNELKLGKMYKKENIHVHYYCMLFSSGLKQAGVSDNDGILGFLPKDIRAESRRGSRLKCYYCKKKGATVGCCSRNCRRAFHLTCGLDADSMHQFFGTFCSFCAQHRPQQEIVGNGESSSVNCPICLNSVEVAISSSSIRSPCCNNSWFHRICIQKQALNAGYFFKCPMCNDQEIFQEEMLRYGIYVPQQDASWEREENAFQELLFRHNHCDAKICICPNGRDYDREGSKWEVKLCALCGSQGIHKQCGRLRSLNTRWECTSCEEIIKRGDDNESGEFSHKSCHFVYPAEKKKRGRKKKRKHKDTEQEPVSKLQGSYKNTKIENVMFPTKNKSQDNTETAGNRVHVTLSQGLVIKISLDDWSSLAKNACKLKQKLENADKSHISWLKLRKQYKSDENSHSIHDMEESELDYSQPPSLSDISDHLNDTINSLPPDLEALENDVVSDIADSEDGLLKNNEFDTVLHNSSESSMYSNLSENSINTHSFPVRSHMSLSDHISGLLKAQTARKSMKSNVSNMEFANARKVIDSEYMC